MAFLKLFSVQKTKRSTGWNKGVTPHFPVKASLCLSKNSCYRCMNTKWHDLLGPPISQSMCSSHWSICGDSSRGVPGHLLEILLTRFLSDTISSSSPHVFPTNSGNTHHHRERNTQQNTENKIQHCGFYEFPTQAFETHVKGKVLKANTFEL